ncbi:MAG: type IV pilus twitching motility protein PilT [Polyangiaceae bacterium]|nr:type IV pilus twitching motility protein PilT [Polyangiaceae bacterium]
MPQLLQAVVEKGASDLHLTAGAAPLLRIDGSVFQLKLLPLKNDEVKQLIYSILTEDQKIKFEKTSELDFSFGIPGLSRFRGNCFVQRGSIAAVFRRIPHKVLGFDELGLPPVVQDIARKPRGLVIVTGATGSGKSTTLASIIDKINTEQRVHILTIEDPIEFVHDHKLAIVNQREVGSDTSGFKDALKHALRQDPDVVLIGEMRDQETVSAALTIAETGHLVFGTLHTNSAVSSITRIIDVFPPHQQQQVRVQISMGLIAVVSQQLLPRATGTGRVLAMEIMVPNPAIRNLIREDKLHQVYSQMQVGQAGSGMQTMNQSLASLVVRQAITVEEAFLATSDQDELRQILQGTRR